MNTAILPANKFAKYAKNNYSQCGEDGILEKILDSIPKKDSWCVEFGAWDGIHLSNTYNLIKHRNYKSVLIEADNKKYLDLRENLKEFESILINKFVMFSGDNTLDKLLSQTPIPQNFDFLSIDIDGNDYHILDSLVLYKPKVICIEFNPTIPNEVNYVQPKDFNVKRGSSARAVFSLAKTKGYSLVAVTRCNLIFVDSTYLSNLEIEDYDLSELRDDSKERAFVFVGFDGTICLSQPIKLIWHDLKVGDEDIQILPKSIRHFRSDYSFIQRLMYAMFILVKNPKDFFSRIKRKFNLDI